MCLTVAVIKVNHNISTIHSKVRPSKIELGHKNMSVKNELLTDGSKGRKASANSTRNSSSSGKDIDSNNLFASGMDTIANMAKGENKGHKALMHLKTPSGRLWKDWNSNAIPMINNRWMDGFSSKNDVRLLSRIRNATLSITGILPLFKIIRPKVISVDMNILRTLNGIKPDVIITSLRVEVCTRVFDYQRARRSRNQILIRVRR